MKNKKSKYKETLDKAIAICKDRCQKLVNDDPEFYISLQIVFKEAESRLKPVKMSDN